MGHLTKQIVEAAKAPAAGQNFIRDDSLRGLALRVTSNGIKSFVWEGRVKGRMRRLTLGQFPAMSVTLARDKALETKVKIARGEDPVLERQLDRAEPTFGELMDSWLGNAEARGLRSLVRSRRRLEAHTTKWRSRRASDISRDEVARLHQHIAEDRAEEEERPKNRRPATRGGKVIANRTITLIRAVFNYAADRGLFRGENPAGRIKLFREERRERFLSPDELQRLHEALDKEPSIYWRTYFLLSLVLGTRRNEMLGARWEDLELEECTWRIPMTKAGRSHTLPLPAPAVELLKALPSREEKHGFVFPGSGRSGHLVEPRKAWERIRTAAKLPDVWVHDLRRTFASWLAMKGYSLTLIGRALNHTNPSSTSIYARLSLDPIRDALEKNAATMLERTVGASPSQG